MGRPSLVAPRRQGLLVERVALLALVPLIVVGGVPASGLPSPPSPFLPTLATASLALLAWVAAASVTRSLPMLTILLTSPVRRWTPGLSRRDLAVSTIF